MPYAKRRDRSAASYSSRSVEPNLNARQNLVCRPAGGIDKLKFCRTFKLTDCRSCRADPPLASSKLHAKISQVCFGRFVMDNTKRLVVNIVGILGASIIGAILTMGIDLGGTRWLKFILYVVFFGAISSPALISSRHSCSEMLRRLRNRS